MLPVSAAVVNILTAKTRDLHDKSCTFDRDNYQMKSKLPIGAKSVFLSLRLKTAVSIMILTS